MNPENITKENATDSNQDNELQNFFVTTTTFDDTFCEELRAKGMSQALGWLEANNWPFTPDSFSPPFAEAVRVAVERIMERTLMAGFARLIEERLQASDACFNRALDTELFMIVPQVMSSEFTCLLSATGTVSIKSFFVRDDINILENHNNMVEV